LFHWDQGLKLTKADLAIDFRRRQPRAFISHAHSDHIARHEYALCTPQTAALYQQRLGPRPTLHMPYGKRIRWGGLWLTAYPAGHCLGSAMLLAEDGKHSLLYTGDFKLTESATAGKAELPQAEILVIECTYGHPEYRMPPRARAITQLLQVIRQVLAADAVPVILAYALGKGQEVTRLLTQAGIPVLQHREIFAVSQVYESFGVSLGRYEQLSGKPPRGWAVVVPPGKANYVPIESKECVLIAVTGWAVEESTKYRFGVDYAIPLSDHADYDELLEAVARVQPRVVYCTHGLAGFVEHLRDAGYDAHPLGRMDQGRLF